jgi:hypothetical protein
MGFVVARHLGVKRENAVLFPAVAAAICRKWLGTKVDGYALVMEYALLHGLRIETKVPPKAVRAALPPEASNDFLLSFAWRQLRMVVLKKRGARCECCGASPRDGQTVINVDHVKPRKLFPELALEESNLQVLCGTCNHGKGNWDQTDWREQSA